jgi:hypothetical protein
MLALSLGAICLTGLTGCTVTAYPNGGVAVDGEVDVVGPPPAPLVDVETEAPGPDYVWIGGAWAWEGGRWNWDRGRWASRPHPGAVWVPHHYENRGGRHTFTRGHWR